MPCAGIDNSAATSSISAGAACVEHVQPDLPAEPRREHRILIALLRGAKARAGNIGGNLSSSKATTGL
jgi:hypothetical protein